jgi:predicted kinase
MTSSQLQLIVLIGLQASGKTTFYHRHFAQSHAHISMDRFPNHRRPRERLLREILAAFALGHSVVVDNTNPTHQDREPLLRLAQQHSAQVIGYVFESILADCVLRNSQRVGRACVPLVGLLATHKKFSPPDFAEGFAQLRSVRHDGLGGFHITEILPPVPGDAAHS